MHLVREVTWRDYRAIYEEFDQVARFAELTPADRHMFWVDRDRRVIRSLVRRDHPDRDVLMAATLDPPR